MDDDTYVGFEPLLDLLKVLPKERVYMGNMIDTALMNHAIPGQIARGEPAAVYLTSYQAPIFAHGMGFLISKDVAEHVVTASASGVPLKSRIADDVGFGVWLQNIEFLHYLNYRVVIHDHADVTELDREGKVLTAVLNLHRVL